MGTSCCSPLRSLQLELPRGETSPGEHISLNTDRPPRGEDSGDSETEATRNCTIQRDANLHYGLRTHVMTDAMFPLVISD